MIYKNLIKRILDIAICLFSIPLVILLIFVISPFVYLEDKGPVFYSAPRMGKDGKIFLMHKIRSMFVNAPDIRNADRSTFNSDQDKRVTKIGRFLRKTSLDEMPQIFNVLCGDMSIIGPRPSLTTTPYCEYDEIRKKRLEVLPGITGYSQAFFRNSISQKEKFQQDCYYVDHMSLIMDVQIFIKTVLVVLKHKNINALSTAQQPENLNH